MSDSCRRAIGAIVLTAVLATRSLAQTPTPPAFNVDSVRAPTKLLEFTATEGTWISVDVAPDGRTLVFDLLGTLYEMPIAGGDARAITRGRAYDQFPRYSPDGTRILFTSDRSGKEELWMLHRGSDSLEKVSKFEFRAFQGRWSRDGRSIYVTSMDLGARYTAYRIDTYGSRTELVRTPAPFGSPTHWNEHPTNRKAYYAQPGGAITTGGSQIRTYDLETGETATYITRVGGAGDPALSPDGKFLAYIHRHDLATELVVHDLETRTERVLVSALDRDRQESGAGHTFGVYPNMSWHPNGQEIFIAWGGKIHAVTVATGAQREIAFRAPVRRTLAKTIRFPVPIPAEGKAKATAARWGQPADGGVLFESLGDIYYKKGDQVVALTSTRALESSPVFEPGTRTVYYVSWTDDSLGTIWSRPLLARSAPVRMTTLPAQYGSLTLSRDGRTLAFLRGSADINRGENLEAQTAFDLVLLGPDRTERRVTEISWAPDNPLAVRRPPGITFSPDGSTLYFTEFERDTLRLKSIRTDGMGERLLYSFPHGQRVLLSPDLGWIAFREYLRSYVTPFAYAGKPITISGFDKQGVALRVDAADGDDTEWTPNGSGLYWTRGTGYYEKPLADVLANKSTAKRTDLTIEYDVAVPASTIALTNARVITMDQGTRVLENATILIRRNKIEAVGTNVSVPSDARVFDLRGKTVMPGIIDAHAHYNPDGSTLDILEQNHAGLVANLAYGVTTLYEVYGNHLKDPQVGDLQRAGIIPGSRLLSTGPPIYGLRWYRPRSFRPILSQADADEIVSFNKDHGATALKDYVQFNRSARMQMYDAARRMGVNVVAETAVDFQMNWTMLMDGVSGLEHTVGLTPLYDDVIKLWAATEAGNTPTLIVVYNGPSGEQYFHQKERLWEDPKLRRFFPEDELLRFRRTTHYFDDDAYVEQMAKELRKLYKAGVSIHVSGHGQMHGLDKHWEMELISKGGFTPAEVLGIATIKSAKYLGLDKQLGSIETGKLADLVILDANPLENIRNTRRIDMVMLNGVLYRGADASRVFPNPEPAGKIYFFRGTTNGSAAVEPKP